MNRTGKILIFFVPDCFDEAIEVNRDSSESVSVLLIQGQGLSDKYRQNSYRIVQAKHGEGSKYLTARVFGISLKEVTEHSLPQRVFELLESVKSTPSLQTQSDVTRGE